MGGGVFYCILRLHQCRFAIPANNYIEYAYIGMKWRFSGKVCKNREHKKKDVKAENMKPKETSAMLKST